MILDRNSLKEKYGVQKLGKVWVNIRHGKEFYFFQITTDYLKQK